MPAIMIGSAGVPPALPAPADRPIWRSRGYLPHLDASNAFQHVVFRLADSLPSAALGGLSGIRSRDRFRFFDSALDQGHGHRHLSNPVIAKLVQASLLAFDGERYGLVAWCVMPNHVHVLLGIQEGSPMHRVVHAWKSYTAKAANRILGRNGTFWAREYFDRFMRNEEHFTRTAAYIEGNPVKAGLCASVADWPFSSAWGGWSRRGPSASSSKEAGGTPALPKTAAAERG